MMGSGKTGWITRLLWLEDMIWAFVFTYDWEGHLVTLG